MTSASQSPFEKSAWRGKGLEETQEVSGSNPLEPIQPFSKEKRRRKE